MSGCGLGRCLWLWFPSVAQHGVGSQTQWQPCCGTLVRVLVPSACLWLGPRWIYLRFSVSPWPFYLFDHSVLIPCDDKLQKLKKKDDCKTKKEITQPAYSRATIGPPFKWLFAGGPILFRF